MHAYSLSHLSDHELHRSLVSGVAQERAATATVLAHFAEFDARRLYLPAAYPSMFAYCVHELHLSEDSALKRIRAARTARQIPVIFEALAGGRLHLSAVVLLTPRLTPDNADELVKAAAHKTKAEIEELLADRFPRPDLPAMVQALPVSGPAPNLPLAPGQEGGGDAGQLAPGPVG